MGVERLMKRINLVIGCRFSRKSKMRLKEKNEGVWVGVGGLLLVCGGSPAVEWLRHT